MRGCATELAVYRTRNRIAPCPLNNVTESGGQQYTCQPCREERDGRPGPGRERASAMTPFNRADSFGERSEHTECDAVA